MQTPYNIHSGTDGPEVLIAAGVHGDEYEPIMAAFKLKDILHGILISGNVRIVPIVNTSAVLANSRYGSDGLDLARICPGKMDGSASEQSAAQISRLIEKADYLIDMHTGGKIFNMHPLAGYMLHSDPEILSKQQQMAKAFNLAVIWGTDAKPNGRTLSVARDAGVPAIYVEYGGGNAVREEIVSAYINGCLNVLGSLNMIADHIPPANQVKYWVDDYTPNNGHLQTKLPASAEGFFTPDVRIGQQVKAGQLWGTIFDVRDFSTKNVFADEEGIVLFLRDAAYVKIGDALGGILPTQLSKI